MKLGALAILASLSLIGCAQQQQVQMQQKFNGKDHDRFLSQGLGMLTGQAFLRQQGGGVVTCAGSDVMAMPATPFFRELVHHMKAGHQIAGIEKVDPKYKPIIQRSQCDAQGNFSFDNLVAGYWLVVTTVQWKVGSSRQGGELVKEVLVSEEDAKHVLLTDQDRAY